jgi:rhodanese-related sulfurtransferase
MFLNDQAPTISVHDLREKKLSGEKFFLLDVRTGEEFQAGHLGFTGALIPHDLLPAQTDKLPQDKNIPIYCFCRSGRRSAGATKYLRSIGYRQAFNVAGGILEWVKSGYETRTGLGNPR